MEYETQQKPRTLEELIGSPESTIVKEGRAMLALRVFDTYLVRYATDSDQETIDAHRADVIEKITSDLEFHRERLARWNQDHLENMMPAMRKTDEYGVLRADLPDPEVSRKSTVYYDTTPLAPGDGKSVFNYIDAEQRAEFLEKTESYLIERIDDMHMFGIPMEEHVEEIAQRQKQLERLHEAMIRQQLDVQIQEGFEPVFVDDKDDMPLHAEFHTGKQLLVSLGHLATRNQHHSA